MNNIEKYKFILDKNEKYGYNNNNHGTGVIYMPLEYYKEWSKSTSICCPHYDCISYVFNLKNELEYLYIFKIKIKEKQIFTCQLSFQSYRAHKDKIDIVNIYINKDKTNSQGESKEFLLEEDLLLNFNFCGIKIIRNDKNFTIMENYNSYKKKNDYDFSSIEELSSLLEYGEYFIMIYPESSLNEGVVRFLTNKEIEIIEINKFDFKNSW